MTLKFFACLTFIPVLLNYWELHCVVKPVILNFVHHYSSIIRNCTMDQILFNKLSQEKKTSLRSSGYQNFQFSLPWGKFLNHWSSGFRISTHQRVNVKVCSQIISRPLNWQETFCHRGKVTKPSMHTFFHIIKSLAAISHLQISYSIKTKLVIAHSLIIGPPFTAIHKQ